ncbi:MAG: mechanosensitive ion channel family protein [Chloroflexi bacterium]|nr:mechanosensitive ion channel family protein [Chloroflexota bacterium]
MAFLELTSQQWLDLGISAGMAALALLLARPLVNFILTGVLARVAGLTRTQTDDLFIQAVRPPLAGLVALLGVQAAVRRLDFVPLTLSFSIDNLFFVSFVVLGFLALWRLVNHFSLWYSRATTTRAQGLLDAQVLPFTRRVSLLLLAAVALIILLDHFGVEVSALVTTLGIGSLAIALAAQAVLADTISGFVIMVDRPFRIGDRIELLDLDTWGDVIDIGLRSSRIQTRDNRMVVIPNSLIGKSLIVNHSYPDASYRLQTDIGVAYGSDLERVRQTLIEAVQAVEGVMPEHPVQALLLAFGESSLDFRVRWWVKHFIDTRILYDRVNTAIYNALQREGISIPFPQRVVHHWREDADDAGAGKGAPGGG